LARKRAAATRGVFPIEDPALVLPERVALDTSLVVRALMESEPLHATCATFIDRLVEGDVTLVFNELLEIELAEAAFSVALSERWGKDWRRRRTDGRVRRRASRLLPDVRKRFEWLLRSTSNTVVPVASVAERAASLMTDYGLASYDAVHAATAIATNAGAIATTDTGFAAIPASLLTVYTDRSRLTSCRAKRSRV
jgi:predicted nucleic acid-binding protein